MAGTAMGKAPCAQDLDHVTWGTCSHVYAYTNHKSQEGHTLAVILVWIQPATFSSTPCPAYTTHPDHVVIPPTPVTFLSCALDTVARDRVVTSGLAVVETVFFARGGGGGALRSCPGIVRRS